MKRFIKAYFNSWWIPILLVLILSIPNSALMMAEMNNNVLTIYVDIFRYFVQLFVFGIFVAGIWNLYKKRWTKAIINILFVLLPFLLLYGMFGVSEDNFAKNLTIPKDIEVFEPKDRTSNISIDKNDTFQVAILDSLKNENEANNSIDIGLTSLLELKRKYPNKLNYYLSAHPAWRVFEKDGKLFATRRWMLGKEWNYVLHGYYTDFDMRSFSSMGKIPRFQSRVTIGLNGEPWAKPNSFRKSTVMKFGSRGKLESKSVSMGQQKKSEIERSDLLVENKDITLEIFEESASKSRNMTKSALDYLNNEFSILLYTIQTGSNSARSLIPKNGIKKGKLVFYLMNAGSPGIYTTHIWSNPGESGKIYLKVFEVTQNIPLSVHRIKKYSNERIGYSDDSSELFFSNGEITIYEGDWGDPYAARFEVWFKPDNGDKERKLLEKVFKIEGWQR